MLVARGAVDSSGAQCAFGCAPTLFALGDEINQLEPVNLVVGGHKVGSELLGHLVNFGGVGLLEHFVLLSRLFINRRDYLTIEFVVLRNKAPELLTGIFVVLLVGVGMALKGWRSLP